MSSGGSFLVPDQEAVPLRDVGNLQSWQRRRLLGEVRLEHPGSKILGKGLIKEGCQ